MSLNWEFEGSRNAPNSVSNRVTEKSAICFEYDDKEGETRRVKINPSGRTLGTQIQVIETNNREFDAGMPELPIPSSGPVYREHCSEDMPVAYCDNPHHWSGGDDEDEKSHIFWGTSRCRTARCPRCWESWDFTAAKPKVAKLEGLKRHWAKKGMDMKLHHISVSLANLNVQLDSKNPRERMTEAVKELLQSLNVDTGYIGYHPWRIAKQYRGDVLGHESGDGDMNWKDIYPLIYEYGWEAVQEEYLTFAPHFHVVCLSEFAQGGELTEEIEERTGIVIERITYKNSPISIRDDLESLCGVMMYVLSHCGLYETDGGEWSAVTPFGRVADFEAVPRIYDEVDEAMREKAWDVLGVDFPDRDDTCTEEIEMPASETVSVRSQSAVRAATGTGPDETMGALWGSGGGSEGSEQTVQNGDGEPVVKDSVTVTRERTCMGSIRPMCTARVVLDDPEWRDAAGEEAYTALAEAFELFTELADDVEEVQLDHPPPP